VFGPLGVIGHIEKCRAHYIIWSLSNAAAGRAFLITRAFITIGLLCERT